MYWRHYNLTAEPFSLTPDPAFLYLSSEHSEAFAGITMGLRERRGLIALVGEVGTGKTTVVYSVLNSLGPEIHTAYVSNARLSFDGILRSAMRDFGIECGSVHRSDLLDVFNEFLQKCAKDGTTAALIIDEAQNLADETFEDLRLLTNFETYKHKLLQIVLVGQPELDHKLRATSLRQVAERIAVRCNVNPLTSQEARQYIEHRLISVNGSLDIFTSTALRYLIRKSYGIPRSMNILCHNAMLFGYGQGAPRVTLPMAMEAVREKEGRGLVTFHHHRDDEGVVAPAAPARVSALGRLSGTTYLATAGLAGAVLAFILGIGALDAEQPATLAEREPTATAEIVDEPAPAPTRAEAPPAEKKERVTREAPPRRAADRLASAPVAVPTAPTPIPPLSIDGGEQRTTLARPIAPAVTIPEATSEERTVVAGARPAAPATPAAPPRPAAPAAPATPAGDADTVKVVRVPRGSSLSQLMLQLYGQFSPTMVPKVQELNPQVRNPDVIKAGDSLRFPNQEESTDAEIRQ